MKKFFDKMASLVVNEHKTYHSLTVPPADKSPTGMVAFASLANAINPKGFRTPGPNSDPTLVEKLAIEAGIINMPTRARSGRGWSKLANREYVRRMHRLEQTMNADRREWLHGDLVGPEPKKWGWETASRQIKAEVHKEFKEQLALYQDHKDARKGILPEPAPEVSTA